MDGFYICPQTTLRNNTSIIEIGGSYGQLRIDAYDVPQIQSRSTVYRDKFVLYPTVRISHLFKLDGALSFDPFMGYSQFGGKSDDLSAAN